MPSQKIYFKVCFYIPIIFKLSTGEFTDCSGIDCFNGGTLESANGTCTCYCPSNTTGLLCAQEMKTSEWPPGPFALPMVSDGCPEDSDRGWQMGRILIKTIYPMTEQASYHGCEDMSYENQTHASFENETYGYISGHFETYELQVNLCYRLPEYLSTFDAHWPAGNYSIYGVNHTCPPGFDVQNVTVCFPLIQTSEQLGSLPIFTILDQNDNQSRLQFSICIRKPKNNEDQDIWNVDRPFAFLKVKDMNCPDFNELFQSSQLSILSLVPLTKRWLLIEQPLSFCFIYPSMYSVGGQFDYWIYSKDLLRERFQDYFALMYVDATLEDVSCGNKPKGFPITDCDEMNKVTLDAFKAVSISGILIQFDSVSSQYRFRKRESFLYIFTSNLRIYTSDIFNTRALQARYVTIYTTDDILANTFITMLSRTSPNVSDTSVVEFGMFGVTFCYGDMGIQDFRIQEFQFKASSAQANHDASQVRPQNNGWCPQLHDLEPYLQIDFLSATMIEGVILYSWMEIEHSKYLNQNNYTLQKYGRQPLFLEYAVSKTFVRYNVEPLSIDSFHAIEEPWTILFEKPFLAQYLRLYPLEDDAQNSICMKIEVIGCRNADDFPQSPIYFDLFDGMLLNVHTSILMVNNSISFATNDIPFTFMDNQVFRWNIYATTSTYLHFQFTDISLRPTEEGPDSMNRDMCEDVVIVTGNSIPTRTVSDSLAYGSTFIFDHRYNGYNPTIPVNFPFMALEFRTCIKQRVTNEGSRGFSLIITETDSNPLCYQEQLCMTLPTILATPNFLGQIMKQSSLYTWHFFNVAEVNTVIKMLDFDVSCSSGTTFSIFDSGDSRIMYCNKNKTTLSVFPNNWQFFSIQFFTTGRSCGQTLFREGFRLYHAKYELDSGDDFRNLTSYQSEFKETQPIWIVVQSYPLYKSDVLEDLPYNGSIRKVCSSHFNKCYTIYIGVYLSFEDGISLCEERNRMLVNLKTKHEMDYVTSLVVKRIKEIGVKHFYANYLYYNVLFGLVRHGIGNKYRNYWLDGSIAEYTAWGVNEPINDERQCTSIMLSNSGGWKTEACRANGFFNAVCEEPLKPIEKIRDHAPMLHYVIDNQNGGTFSNFSHLMFRCNNSEFVSRLSRCNGIEECADGSDEEECLQEGECAYDEFKCDVSRCIHISRVCNHVQDCNDVTDESCYFKSCEQTDFMCDGGVCHESNERCDTIKHCKDGSDEINCDFCGNFLRKGCGLSKICLPENAICNGVVECPDGSDEENCKPEIKTCDDYVGLGMAMGRLDTVDKNISCEFYLDDFTNHIHQMMTFLNIDWSFEKEAEYNIESHGFIMFALENGYNCSQKYTQEARRDKEMVNELLNKPENEFEQIEFKFTLPSAGDRLFSEIAHTDTFEVEFTQDNLKLRYKDNFDIANKRITFGPLQCYKDIGSNTPINCGDGIRSVSEDLLCVYDVDNEFNDQGCVTLNHLYNCTDFICPDQYVKCPDSYCIHPHRVCDGHMDCPNGEDEKNCWCAINDKTFLVLISPYAGDEMRQRACKLAGELYSQGGTVMYIFYQAGILPVVYGHMIYSSAGHCLYHYPHRYKSYPLFSSKPDMWSLEDFKAFHKTWNKTISTVLLWMTDVRLNEKEQTLNNYLKWVIERLGSNVTVYNIFSEPTIQTNIKIFPSAVTEILVRNWEVIDSIGPWLLKDECTGVSNTSCAGGYRCLSSRVCLALEQICDGKKHCPHADDEINCDFLCPSFCSCGLLTMKCEENINSNTSIFDLNIPFSTRTLDLSNTDTFGKDFLMSYDVDEPSRLLISLNISNCKIPSISYPSFSRLKNLRALDLSHNRIKLLTQFIFSNLTHLTNLYLHGNSLLSSIEPGTFHGLKIRSLDLTGCSILSISKNTFVGLFLDYLDISFNKIDTIEDLAFNSLATRQLKLQGNSINQFSKKMFDGIQSLELLNTPAFKFCCIRPPYLEETSCLPYKDEFSSCADLMRNPIMQALLWVIGSLALLGNIASLVYRIHFDKYRLRLGYGIFVTNLALSDMFMGIYMLIIAVADNMFRGRYIEVDTYWRSSSWCKLAGMLSTLSSEASVFFVALITIDRILVIKFPFGNVRVTSKRAVTITVLIWIFVVLLSVLPLINVEYFSEMFYGKSAVCLALPLTRDRPPGWIFSFGIFVGFNFVMFVLIAFGQVLIYTEIRKQTQATKKMNVSRRNDLTVARNLLLLVSTDFLCWFPIGVMGLMALDGYVVPGDVYAWTAVMVLPINSALNPFLYTLSAIMNKKSFNPSVDEQKHENSKTASAISFLQMLSHFSHGSRRFRSDLDLSNLLVKKSLVKQEALLIARDLAKGLSTLHDEDLVMKTLDSKSVGIRLSFDMVRKAYLNPLPHVLKHKREKLDDIYQFGILINECTKSLAGTVE